MRIEHVSTIHNNFIKNKKIEEPEKQKEQTRDAAYQLRSKFNDHMIAFKARVDKGLERFYDTNKDRMPLTVKRYVVALEDKTRLTPLQAQNRAFSKLNEAKNVKDIKKYFESEELFSDLIEPEQSKATRGILQSLKENSELLALSGESILKDNTDFTVYLVKKVFLEAKTIDEINKDLENDLNEDFKADFKFKNKDAKYVYGSTLKSLGIKMPPFEYQQSLRYTRDGYSDLVGENISQAQRKFWDSLSPEERTARAKKSVEKFEIWWNSFTNNQKLDLIADQLTALDLLKDFKKQQHRETKNHPAPAAGETPPDTRTTQHTKVGSSKLSQDELFIRWATNNLKLFEANLSEADKDTLHLKRMQRLVDRWANMSSAEKTDYISKMKSGSEPLRYTMIDAWNHSMDLIKDLSAFLREKHIFKPSDLLYSTEQFSTFQSEIMTEFWANNPDYAVTLGNNIRESQQKINTAIKRGTFEELKKQIMRDKNQRVKEMEKFKQSLNADKTAPKSKDEIPEYFKEFKSVYHHTIGAQLKNLPQKYVSDYFNIIMNGYTQAEIEAWTRHLKGMPMEPGDADLLEHIRTSEPEGSEKCNRAIEAAVADTLYDCTHNPDVYKFSHSDVKVALQQIDRGERLINIGSHKLNQMFEMPLIKRRIDTKRISLLYNSYTEPLTEKETDNIINGYFDYRGGDETRAKLEKYIQTYGKSANIIFSDKSAFSKEIKAAMYQKFMFNMPDELYENVRCYLDTSAAPFEREDDIKRVKHAISRRFDFVPQIYMTDYLTELGKLLRNNDRIDYDTYVNVYCQKRKDPKANGKLMILSKTDFDIKNKMRTIAMEEVLADILYESTQNPAVYKFSFEELCDNIELFNLVKKFPSETRHFKLNSTKEPVDLTAHKRLDMMNIQKKYLEYLNEIIDWINTDVKNSEEASLEELVYILNPDENMPEKDAAVIERLKLHGINIDANDLK